MASSEAQLTLVLKARDLAAGAVDKLGDKIEGVASTATRTAGRIGSAFAGLGGALANGVGNAVETLSSGGGLGTALLGLGTYMAGQLAEQFAGSFIERIAGSGFIAVLTAPLAAAGTAIGGLISAAIPIGMALLPVILIGALVAAIAVLIANPDIRNKVIGFVQDLVGHLVDALGTALRVLPQVIGDAFGAAWSFVVDSLLPFILQMVELWFTLPARLVTLGAEIVHTIIDGLSSLPGKVADVVGNAFRSLKLDIGPFHISGGGVTVDLPQIDVPHFAGGVRNFRGGAALVGELGPELVRLPRGSDVLNHRQLADQVGGGGDAFTIVGVSRAELARIANEGLYVQLRRAGTGG